MIMMSLLGFRKKPDRKENWDETSELSFTITNDYPDTSD